MIRGLVSAKKSDTRDGATAIAAAGATSIRRPSSPSADRIGTTLFRRRSAASEERQSASVDPSSNAPVATCAVVTRTDLRVRTVRAPSAICRQTSTASPAAAFRSPGRPEPDRAPDAQADQRRDDHGPDAVREVDRHGKRVHRRHEPSQSEREVRDREPRLRVAHHGADEKLEEDRAGRHRGDPRDGVVREGGAQIAPERRPSSAATSPRRWRPSGRRTSAPGRHGRRKRREAETAAR